jgi:hypothetical protein
MADIEIAIRAKNEASAAINQTSADLASLSANVSSTGDALKTLGGVPQGLTGASTAIQGVEADFASLSSAVNDAVSSINGVRVEPVDLVAADGITPVLDDIRAQVEAGDLDVPPLELTAVDNVSPIVEDIAAQANALADQIEPAKLEIDDSNWRASIDDMLARTAEMTAETERLAKAWDDVTPKPVTLTAKDNVTPAAKNAGSALQQFDNVAGQVAGGLGGLDSALALGGAALGLAGVVQLTQALYSLADAGAGFSELQGASEALGTSFGVNAKYMQYSMREAAEGTISDSALMLAANRAIVTGVTKNADVMAQLVTEAKARGDAFGLSSAQAFDTLITGIGNAAPRMLKQLGYTIDLTEANEAYAASIGTTADKLSEQQQRAAVLSAVMAQAGQIPGTDSAADSFERLGVSVERAKLSLGALIAPSLVPAIDAVSAAVDELARRLQGLPGGLQESLGIATNQLQDWQNRLGAAEQQNAGVSDFLFGTTSAGTFGPQIEAANEQIAAMTALKNTVELVGQAYDMGTADAGRFASETNALAQAAAANGGLTKEQAAQVFALNAEVSNAIRGMGEMSTAEGMLGGAIAGTNPAIDEQAGKLKALWIAAAGALGAAQAFKGYQDALKETKVLEADLRANAGARKAGDIVPPDEFLQAEALADAKKQVDEITKLANEPITLELAIESTATAAAQKAYTDAIKASGDTTAASQQATAAAAATTDEVTRQVEAWQDAGYTTAQITNFLLPGMRSQLTSANDGVSEMAKRFEDVKSKVGSVIQEAQKLPSFKASDLYDPGQLDSLGLSGDSAVSIDQAANGGRVPDSINENAKRLMAIAKEGITDQSWLEEFKREVPAVFAELENSPDIRGSALRILQEFEAGLRPELLDRGMIKDRVKAMIIGDQNAAALAQEIAQEIATEMGISLQQAMAATNTALGTGTGEGAGGSNVQAPDMTPQGTLAGESLRAGMVAGFNASGLTVEIVAKIDAEFSNPKSIDAIKKSGGSVGAVWGSGFLATVGTNIPPGLYDVLVGGLVPLIVAAIGQNATRTGANP